MLAVILVIGLLGCDNVLCGQKMLALLKDYSKDSLVSCVEHILKQYYVSEELLTFIEMGYDDDRLLEAVHAQALLSVVHRKPIINRPTYFPYNKAYLVAAGNVTDFTQNFTQFTRDPTWNPHAKFIIIINLMKEVEMRKIFDILLDLHVLNVLVINVTDPFVYTYNPYEDYACGKYYNRIINFGRCPTSVDLYPNKLITGLQRCTMTITVPHWPPYTIHPSKLKPGMLSKGVEQFVIDIIGDKEQFNITYIYKDQNEEYSTIAKNMTAIGPLKMLQTNETDIMMGGMGLSPTRAAAFDYVYNHLPLADDVIVLVKTSPFKPVWANFYLPFHISVWLLLLLCFTTFAALMLLLLKRRDLGYVYLVMLDTLLSHRGNITGRWTVRCIFLIWVWFAYLLNCAYQTSLMSFTTKPTEEIGYTKVKDILEYNFKICISPFMTKLIETERNYQKFPMKTEKVGCDNFLESIKTVGVMEKGFTVVMYSVYLYHKHQFYDDCGRFRVRTIDMVLFKVNYAMFMNKGFAIKNRLQKLTLRLRESGLVQNYIRFQQYFMYVEYEKNAAKRRKFRTHLVIPWYLYAFGHVLSTIVFFAEHISKIKATRRNRII